ncbi:MULTISPECIES: acyl-CoA thioesterase [unclassified Xanthobacter]|uniref:acyl-CoA thioesterase n=1 Tax=unclassified Xanthobacter TaxID=2623496 RepID=UPI001EDEE903|nr:MULTISPECIES: thioesterase family protein [unclassified Xanthobacter]
MSTEKPPLPRLDAFPVRTRDTVRFADTDKLGHVNNAVFSTFLETGRASMLLGPGVEVAPAGTSFVIVRLELDFRAELMWPGEVEIGTRIATVGRSSIGLSQALFQNGVCAATAQTVLVLFDTRARAATPLPPESRALLERYM